MIQPNRALTAMVPRLCAGGGKRCGVACLETTQSTIVTKEHRELSPWSLPEFNLRDRKRTARGKPIPAAHGTNRSDRQPQSAIGDTDFSRSLSWAAIA
mgnify:CR=1 FL=1